MFVSEKLPSAALQAKAKRLELSPTFYNYLDAPPCKGCIGCCDEEDENIDSTRVEGELNLFQTSFIS